MDVDRNLPSKIKSWRNRGLHGISPQGKGTLKTVIDMTPKSQQRSGLGDPTKQTGKIGHRHIVHSTSQTVAAKSVELQMSGSNGIEESGEYGPPNRTWEWTRWPNQTDGQDGRRRIVHSTSQAVGERVWDWRWVVPQGCAG